METRMVIGKDSERQLAYLASALEEAMDTIRAKTHELSLVRGIGDAIGSSNNKTTLSTELLRVLPEPFNARYAAIYAGPVAAPFELQAVSTAFTRGTCFPETIAGSSMAKWMYSVRQPLRIDNLRSSLEWSHDWPFPADLDSWLITPIVEGDDMYGLLCMGDEPPGSFNEKAVATLGSLIPLVSGAYARIEAHHKFTHDLNNVLSIILPNAELIRMQVAEHASLSRPAEAIVNASHRAARMTRQLVSCP